jgi:hypothetical protein
MNATKLLSLDSFIKQPVRTPETARLIYRGMTIDYSTPKPSPILPDNHATHPLIYRGTTIDYPVFPVPAHREPKAIN